MEYGKTLKHTMIDKKIDKKEELEFEETYNHYLDKRSVKMKNSQFKFEDVFVEVLYKESIQPE